MGGRRDAEERGCADSLAFLFLAAAVFAAVVAFAIIMSRP